jgi:hypothetical protein
MDDFALRKRHTSGTIPVDLERRQPVALLPERTAAPASRCPPSRRPHARA